MPTFYEFFAGGGMARAGLGLEWNCVFANDISPKKAASYSQNWGESHLVVEDVFKIKVSQLPGTADLAWGSFPCQDLSLAGIGSGLDGAHSGAFWGFWSLIEKLRKIGRKPKLIVLENVYGTLTSHDGNDFEQIAKAISKSGYVFGAVVIDAVYFLPQSRPRLFVIGVDSDLTIPSSLTSPITKSTWHPDAVLKAYNNLPNSVKSSWRWWNIPVPSKPKLTLESIIEESPTGVKWHTHFETSNLISMMSPLHRQKLLEVQKSGSQKVGTIYRRTRNGTQMAEVRFDGIAGCLRTPSGGSSRQTIIVVEGSKIRTRLISTREAARLMGISDKYNLPEKYNEAYHLVGDGVAVPVVAHLNRFLLKPIIDHNSASANTLLPASRKLKA
jgi:DNA (cytosine-5)-methyltransferase 1